MGCRRGADEGGGRGRGVYEEGGQGVDAAGASSSSEQSDAELDGLASLTAALANGADAPACFTEQRVYFGYAISDSFAHGCNQELLEDRFVQSDLTFEELIVGMTQLTHFTHRAPDHWTPQTWYDGERPSVDEMPLPDPQPDPEPDPQPDPDPPVVPNPGGEGITTNDPGLVIGGGISNDWGAGYCMELDVTLEQGSGVTWAVTIDVDGTITNNWESVASGDSGVVTFTGAPYNATLDSGGKAHFGFCANR